MKELLVLLAMILTTVYSINDNLDNTPVQYTQVEQSIHDYPEFY